MKRYKLINKSKFYSFILFTASIVCIGILMLNMQSVQGESLNKYDIIIVDSGDTIWEIAEKYNQSQYQDLREYVYEIKKANDIFGDILKPNQKLRIPRAL